MSSGQLCVSITVPAYAAVSSYDTPSRRVRKLMGTNLLSIYWGHFSWTYDSAEQRNQTRIPRLTAAPTPRRPVLTSARNR
jgi:hypothetical protein